MPESTPLSELSFLKLYERVKQIRNEVEPYLMDSSPLYMEIDALHQQILELEGRLKRKVIWDKFFSTRSVEISTYFHLFSLWPQYSPHILGHADRIVSLIDEQYEKSAEKLRALFNTIKEALDLFKKIDECSQPFFKDQHINGYINWLHACPTVAEMIAQAEKYYQPSEKKTMFYSFTQCHKSAGLLLTQDIRSQKFVLKFD